MTLVDAAREPERHNVVEGQLQPVTSGDPPQLTLAEASKAWRLAAEPWVFVVDKDGVIRSSLMLIFGDEELEAAIDEVTS